MSRENQIVEEAAGWIDRLNQPAFDAAAGPDFDAWMAASPRHREVFADLQALWHSEALVEALGQAGRAPIIAQAPPEPDARFRRNWATAPGWRRPRARCCSRSC